MRFNVRLLFPGYGIGKDQLICLIPDRPKKYLYNRSIGFVHIRLKEFFICIKMILYLLKRMCFIRVNITGQTRFGVNQRRVFAMKLNMNILLKNVI